MTPPHTRRAVLLIACLALAACKPSGKDAGGTAAGTILPGSTSDAMIPLDQVRSQPPLAPAGSGEGGGKKAAAKASDGAEAKATPAPADAGGDAAPAAPAAADSAPPQPAAGTSKPAAGAT